MKFFSPKSVFPVVAVAGIFALISISISLAINFPKERWRGYRILFVDRQIPEKTVLDIFLKNGFEQNDFFSLSSIKVDVFDAETLQQNDFFRYTPKSILLHGESADENYLEKRQAYFFDKDNKAQLYYIKIPKLPQERYRQNKKINAVIAEVKKSVSSDSASLLCGVDSVSGFVSLWQILVAAAALTLACFLCLRQPAIAEQPILAEQSVSDKAGFAALHNMLMFLRRTGFRVLRFFRVLHDFVRNIEYALNTKLKTKVHTAVKIGIFVLLQNVKKSKLNGRIFYVGFAPFPIRQNAFLGFETDRKKPPLRYAPPCGISFDMTCDVPPDIACDISHAISGKQKTRRLRRAVFAALMFMFVAAAAGKSFFFQKMSKNDLYLPTPKRYNVPSGKFDSRFDLQLYTGFTSDKRESKRKSEGKSEHAQNQPELPDLGDFILWAHSSAVFPYKRLGDSSPPSESAQVAGSAVSGEFIAAMLEYARQPDFFAIEKMLQEQKTFASVTYSK
ncbi:MAG: hypothetical protein Ta2A_20470 [Treponemataceae bacterium]|nr:MAG: hypothetical protein Ta2A_20470 [Treponemataceae bacterium]